MLWEKFQEQSELLINFRIAHFCLQKYTHKDSENINLGYSLWDNLMHFKKQGVIYESTPHKMLFTAKKKEISRGKKTGGIIN